MCIIVAVPAGVASPKRQHLETAWESNKDYGGAMWINENGRINIGKWKEKDEIIDNFYLMLEKYGKDSPVVLHLRNATDGSVTLDNTHPFRLNNKSAFCHNGRIVKCIPTGKFKDKNYSDTRVFRDQILRYMPSEWTPGIRLLLEEYIGKSSRIAWMDVTGNLVLLNEALGEWVNGVWFSNDYYKFKRRTYQGHIYDWTGAEDEWEAWADRVTSGNPVGYKPLYEKIGRRSARKVICDGCNKSSEITTGFWLTNYDKADIGKSELRKLTLCISCRTKYIQFVNNRIEQATMGLFVTQACALCDRKDTGTSMNTCFDADEGELAYLCYTCFWTVFKDYGKIYGPRTQWFVGTHFDAEGTGLHLVGG
jgi:hypothetical protein